MSTPDQEAPAVLRVHQDGRIVAEIVGDGGEAIDYLITPHEAGGAVLHRPDALRGPYRVWKPAGRLWACPCKDSEYRAKREARSCKHVVFCRALARLAPVTEALTRTEAIPMATMKRKPDAAVPADVPARTPEPAAPAEGPPARDAARARAMSPRQLRLALADPFPAAAVGWKPQAAKGDRALAVAYIDARDVMDRLDEVLGVDAWRAEYVEHADGTVTCTLALRMPDGSWLAKTDVGGESEQKDVGDRKKAAYSDALKRAAVQWGIGRYLYSLPTVWADYDEKRRAFVRPPSLPAWALPGGSGRPPGVQAPQAPETQAPGPQAPAAPPGPEFHRALVAYDEAKGYQGALVRHVATTGKRLGYPDDLTLWTTPEIAEARKATRDFEAKLQQKAG